MFYCSQCLLSHIPPSFPMDMGPGKASPSCNSVPITEENHHPIRLTFPYWKSQLPARCSPLCPGAHCYPPPPCSGPALPRHSPSARPRQADMLSLVCLSRRCPLPSLNQDQGLLFSTFPPVSAGIKMKFLGPGVTSHLYPKNEEGAVPAQRPLCPQSLLNG